MNVKCPKCRYRFDVPSTPGMNELACVCPRCGTPFDYKIESETTVDERTTSATDDTPQAVHRPKPSSSQTPPQWKPRQEAGIRKEQTGSGVPNQGWIHPDIIPPPPQGGFPWGKFLSDKLLWIIVLLVVFFFAVSRCGSDDGTGANSSDVYSSEISAGNMGSTTSEEPQTPPKWLAGTWKATTRYGDITITIKGNRISETTDGETSRGTFVYTPGRLTCDFGDGQKFVYFVNEPEHGLDAGEGIPMKKVK